MMVLVQNLDLMMMMMIFSSLLAAAVVVVVVVVVANDQLQTLQRQNHPVRNQKNGYDVSAIDSHWLDD